MVEERFRQHGCESMDTCGGAEEVSSICSRKSPSPPGPQPDAAVPHIEDSIDASSVASDSTVQTPPNPALPELRLPTTGDHEFDVGAKYVTHQIVGKGAFGYVMSAECSFTGHKVAIKKIKNATADKVAALRLLREMRFLRQARGHPNVINLQDVLVRQSHQVDVYLVTELMEADLEQIIKSSQVLSDDHVRYLTSQMLCGLRHLHQHGIIHRDLKPSNLVVDSFCKLKICDLGLSRHIRDASNNHNSTDDVPEGEDALFTDYVVTRWYRAPELLLGSRRYSLKVDMWAAGCIMAELISRRPMFNGDDPSDMLLRIAAAIGRPTDRDAAALGQHPGVSPGARAFLRGLQTRPLAERPLEATVGGAGRASDLLRGLLTWDSSARLSVEAALTHPYLAALYEAPLPAAAAQMEDGGSFGVLGGCRGMSVRKEEGLQELSARILHEASMCARAGGPAMC